MQGCCLSNKGREGSLEDPMVATSGGMQERLPNLNEQLSPSDVRSANSSYALPHSPSMAKPKGNVHSGQIHVYIPWRPLPPMPA